MAYVGLLQSFFDKELSLKKKLFCDFPFFGQITKETHKAIFFKYYIYAVSYAVGIAFYYHCPGSRNMYDTTQTSFKLDIFQYMSSLLCGMDLLPDNIPFSDSDILNSDIDLLS